MVLLDTKPYCVGGHTESWMQGRIEFALYPFHMNTNEMSASDLSKVVTRITAEFAALGVMPTPGQTVADIGSGPALVAFALIRHVADATCISIRPTNELDDARALAAHIGVQDRVTFQELDIAALDFEADSLDVALLGERIHGLDDEQLCALLANLRRAVRPGGVLYIAGGSTTAVSDVTLGSRLAESSFDDVSQAPGGSFVLRRFALSSV